MRLRTLLFLAVLLLTAVVGSRSVHAGGGIKYNVKVPHSIELTFVGDEFWSSAVPGSGNASAGDGWSISGSRLTFTGSILCPDSDDTLTGLSVATGSEVVLAKRFPKHGLRGRHFEATVDLAPEGVTCASGDQHGVITLSAVCTPFIGDPRTRTMSAKAPVTAVCDPPTIQTRVAPGMWTHMCPAGYEFADASPTGYGVSSAESPSKDETCRRAFPGEIGPPPGEDRSPDDIALEAYEQKLADARTKLSVFNQAGIYTIFDLARTSRNNLTSVLGIEHGDRVGKAAQQSIGASRMIDPNWLFDEYFLINPTWFVDPRVRGTASATARIAKAQKQLLGLQKRDILTLDDLARARPRKVARAAAVSRTQAGGWITQAKALTAFSGDASALSIHNEWIIHPAWLVDPGLLPSVRVIRNAKEAPGKPTVTAHTPADLTTSPPTILPSRPNERIGKPAPAAKIGLYPKPEPRGGRRKRRGTSRKRREQKQRRTSASPPRHAKPKRRRRIPSGNGGRGARGRDSIPRGEGGQGSRGRD